MQFEWDENKNQSNYGETREITIGEVSKNIVLVLVHTDRFGNIRIISARKANERERSKYYEHR